MMSDEARETPPDNPYAAPASIPEFPHSSSTESDEERQLRAFVGSRADYYLDKWRPFLAHSERSTGFNWTAFLLSGLWLSYRKMYWVTTIFLVIILVESLVEDVLFVRILGHAETPDVLGRVVNLVAALACGSYGNRWYLSHAKKVIADVRGQGLDEKSMEEVLSRRGGTSIGSALAFFLAFMVVVFAVFLALEFVLLAADGLMNP